MSSATETNKASGVDNQNSDQMSIKSVGFNFSDAEIFTNLFR